MKLSGRRGLVLARYAGAVGLVLVIASDGQAQLRRVVADIQPVVSTEPVQAGSEVRVGLRVRLPEGLHVQSDRPRDPSLIPTALTIDPPAGIAVREISFPPALDLRQRGVDQPLAVFDGQFTIDVRLAPAGTLPAGDVMVPARLRYQACDDAMCYPPSTAAIHWTFRVVSRGAGVSSPAAREATGTTSDKPRTASAESRESNTAGVSSRDGTGAIGQLAGFEILGTTGGYLSSNEFLAFVRNAEQGVREVGWFEGKGPVAVLLIVFLGGLALNLTPCVLPMIPINLAIIGAGAQAGTRRRGLLLGATYGAAMAVVYGLLGLVVILTAGTFGSLNASPWFNAGIAIVFVMLGLAMFDRITIDFSRWSSRFSPGNARGSFPLAFTMGGVAALQAGACVAPVVIQVVLFSSSLYAAGTTSALALPFLLGLGMAAPWPAAGAGFASLPKPGAWMVRIKQAFGVLILGTAAYYGYLGYGLFADRWVDRAAVSSSVNEKLSAGWHASLSDGLATAANTGQPVLVDLWATWCKNCLTMDKTTFADPQVVSVLSGYVKVKFQAEQPDEEPSRSVMEHFRAVGLPTYVLLRPIAKTAGNVGANHVAE
ncbi:MAG: protein-disulfide reductase DsbD family protein [Vicinamibacterales bacterium]